MPWIGICCTAARKMLHRTGAFRRDVMDPSTAFCEQDRLYATVQSTCPHFAKRGEKVCQNTVDRTAWAEEEKYWRRLRCGFSLLLGVDALLTSEEQLSLPDCDTKPAAPRQVPGGSVLGRAGALAQSPLSPWRSHQAKGWAWSCSHPKWELGAVIAVRSVEVSWISVQCCMSCTYYFHPRPASNLVYLP